MTIADIVLGQFLHTSGNNTLNTQEVGDTGEYSIATHQSGSIVEVVTHYEENYDEIDEDNGRTVMGKNQFHSYLTTPTEENTIDISQYKSFSFVIRNKLDTELTNIDIRISNSLDVSRFTYISMYGKNGDIPDIPAGSDYKADGVDFPFIAEAYKYVTIYLRDIREATEGSLEFMLAGCKI